jgi:hypothetical protein
MKPIEFESEKVPVLESRAEVTLLRKYAAKRRSLRSTAG